MLHGDCAVAHVNNSTTLFGQILLRAADGSGKLAEDVQSILKEFRVVCWHKKLENCFIRPAHMQARIL